MLLLLVNATSTSTSITHQSPPSSIRIQLPLAIISPRSSLSTVETSTLVLFLCSTRYPSSHRPAISLHRTTPRRRDYQHSQFPCDRTDANYVLSAPAFANIVISAESCPAQRVWSISHPYRPVASWPRLCHHHQTTSLACPECLGPPSSPSRPLFASSTGLRQSRQTCFSIRQSTPSMPTATCGSHDIVATPAC